MSPSGKKKGLSPTKLRGWAKKQQDRVDALEKSFKAYKIRDRIPASRVRQPFLAPSQRQELEKQRATIWYVQDWTYAGVNEDGHHTLLSLETGKIEAVLVWFSLNAVSQHTSLGPLPPFDEWIAAIIKEEGKND